MAPDRLMLQITPAADGWRAAFAAYDAAHPIRLCPLVCWALVEERAAEGNHHDRPNRSIAGLVVDGDKRVTFCDQSPMFLGYVPPTADIEDLEEKAFRFWEEKAKRGELHWPPGE